MDTHRTSDRPTDVSNPAKFSEILRRRELLALGGLVATTYAVAIAELASRRVDRLLPPGRLYVPSPDDVTMAGQGSRLAILACLSLTCPHCCRWETRDLPDIASRLPEGVTIHVRDFPLDAAAFNGASFVHCLPGSMRAAAHQALAASYRDWAGGSMAEVSRCSAVDTATADHAARLATDPAVMESIAASASAANRYFGIDAAPAFVIGPRVVTGEMDRPAFLDMISAALTSQDRLR